MKPTFHKLKVKDVRKETADCCSIAFDVPEDLKSAYQFVQGQYLTLRTDINEEDIRRSYSICTSPSEDDLRVAVKQVEDGKFSTYANNTLKEGDVLDVMTPVGNFYTELNPENKKHYVAFAAGSGITPIISIMKTVLEIEHDSEFTLFYGNKNTASIIFKEEIEALKNIYMERLTVHYFLSREVLDTPMMNGRLDESKCKDIFDKLVAIDTIDECFSCGPETMIFAVRDILKERGFDESKIHFELFTSSSTVDSDKKKVVKEEDKGRVTNVTVNLDGKAFQFDLPFGTDSILDAA